MRISFVRFLLLIFIPFALLTYITSVAGAAGIWWFLAGFLYAVLVMTILDSTQKRATRRGGASEGTVFRRRD